MGIRTKLLSEHGVVITIYSGTVTPDELGDYIDRLPSTDKGLYLNYVEPMADFSHLSVTFIPEFQRLASVKLHELYGNRRVSPAWVCEPGADEAFVDFWRRYREVSAERPESVVMFHTVQAACDWLGLTEAARQAAIEAIET